jgi:hypothetical protein
MVKLRPLPCASYKTNSTKEKAASTRVECQRVQIDRASYQHHAQGPQESMAESREVFIEGPSQHVSGSWSVLCASLTGMAIGGPLLGMTGFSFLAAVTLLLVSSPLLLLFSPLLFCAARPSSCGSRGCVFCGGSHGNDWRVHARVGFSRG